MLYNILYILTYYLLYAYLCMYVLKHLFVHHAIVSPLLATEVHTCSISEQQNNLLHYHTPVDYTYKAYRR